jgi:magnesium transporter
MDDLKSENDLESGSLVFEGDNNVKSNIKLIEYNKDVLKKEKYELCRQFEKKDTVKWIIVDGFSFIEIQEIGKCFNLHNLVLEDIKTDNRPKIEEYENYLFIILKSFKIYKNKIVTKQVSLILGEQFVISFQEEGTDLFDSVEKQIKISESEIRRNKNDFLLYALINAILNSYSALIEEMEDKIDEIETELVYNANKNTLNSINKLKKNIITLQKSIWPLQEMTRTLQTNTFHLINDTTSYYLRDLHDHSVQISAMLDFFRDTTSGMLDTYLSSMSNNLNDIVRVLTIITVIFAPLTFITGFFGMNFQNIIPIFSTAPIFDIFLLITIFIPIMMIIYFKRKGWLGV